jgi:hypothetical protein
VPALLFIRGSNVPASVHSNKIPAFVQVLGLLGSYLYFFFPSFKRERPRERAPPAGLGVHSYEELRNQDKINNYQTKKKNPFDLVTVRCQLRSWQ